MDLQSYIKLKEQYALLHTPQQEEVAEQVEAVEEEILSEEELQENPNTWNNPLGQISRTATKMFGNAQQIKGVRQNEKDIQDREDAVFRAGGGNARQRELEKKGFLSGQARRAVMNQGDRNNAQARREQGSNTATARANAKGSQAGSLGSTGDALGGRDVPRSSGSSDSRRSTFPDTSGNQGRSGSGSSQSSSGSSSGSGAKASTQGSRSNSGSSQRASAPAQRSSSPRVAPAPSSSQGAAKVSTSAPKAQTGDKKADMNTWAKANPALAAAKAKRDATRGTTASSNPLMKGLGRKAPAAATAPKASPSAGARAALSAAGAKFNPNAPKIKLTNSVDMSEFDIIIEHLVEQGFAVDEALKLMVDMSEEKREQIIAERSREFTDMRDAQNAAGARGPELSHSVKKTTKPLSTSKTVGSSVDRGPEFRQRKPLSTSKTVGSSVDRGPEFRREGVEPSNKQSMDSLADAYRSIYVKEEESDARKDRQLERGGVGSRADYSKPPKQTPAKQHGVPGAKTAAQKEAEEKYGKGVTAMDIVKANLEKKYGKGVIMDTKKKKEDKKD